MVRSSNSELDLRLAPRGFAGAAPPSALTRLVFAGLASAASETLAPPPFKSGAVARALGPVEDEGFRFFTFKKPPPSPL